MIIGAAKLKINQNGDGVVNMPELVYYSMLGQMKTELELILSDSD